MTSTPAPYPGLQTALARKIEEHGMAVVGVSGPDGPTFTYTIGLFPYLGCELIMIGLRPDYAGFILNDIRAYVESQPIGQKRLHYDRPYPDFANMPLVFKTCKPELVRKYVVQADQFWGQGVAVSQVVMCDPKGKFPWEDGFDHAYMDHRQPALY